jgi:ribosome recycling factor
MQSSEDTKGDLDKIIKKLKEDLSGMRTGRVSAALAENIQVDYYGSKVPLKQIASITVPDARLIVVEPWGKENLKDIISAISSANLGANPVTDGVAVKIAFPPMNEEERKKTVKLTRERAEKAKISLRFLRDKKREEIKNKEKNKEIGKDDKFRQEKDLQKIIDAAADDIGKISAEKEKEIMTI